jgi:hypothetical protein
MRKQKLEVRFGQILGGERERKKKRGKIYELLKVNLMEESVMECIVCDVRGEILWRFEGIQFYEYLRSFLKKVFY